MNAASVAVLSLDTGEQHVVVEGGYNARYLPTGHLVFGRDGALWGVPFDLARLVTTGPEEVVLQGIEVADAEGGNGTMALSVSADGTLVYWPGDAVDIGSRTLTRAGAGPCGSTATGRPHRSGRTGATSCIPASHRTIRGSP
jgi:serine/threonine-protein kinase